MSPIGDQRKDAVALGRISNGLLVMSPGESIVPFLDFTILRLRTGASLRVLSEALGDASLNLVSKEALGLAAGENLSNCGLELLPGSKRPL